MSVRNSLLAILVQSPCYGYQLRQEFDRRTGANWPLNVGQVYSTLDRLERDGLVTLRTPDDEGHVIYEVTDAGLATATRWLADPVARAAPERDELAIKLALAVTLPGVDPLPIIQSQRARTGAALLELTAQRPATLAAELVLEAQLASTRAELEWLDACEGRVRALGDASKFGMESTSPRRGRPLKSRS
jgi:DNA-binding PadR family transcriptional regulator